MTMVLIHISVNYFFTRNNKFIKSRRFAERATFFISCLLWRRDFMSFRLWIDESWLWSVSKWLTKEFIGYLFIFELLSTLASDRRKSLSCLSINLITCISLQSVMLKKLSYHTASSKKPSSADESLSLFCNVTFRHISALVVENMHARMNKLTNAHFLQFIIEKLYNWWKKRWIKLVLGWSNAFFAGKW